MNNYVQEGNFLTLTAPSGGVVSGVLYLIGTLAVVATVDAAEGESFAASTRGVHDLAKTSAQAWTEGAEIYRDAVTGAATTVSTDNTLIGKAAAVAANPSATGAVLLTVN